MTITAQHPHPLRLGAAYYPEYQPSLDLERDLDLMRAAHFNVIRVGESVWSTWERRDTPVTVLSGVANGTRVHFVHNWSGSVAHAVTPHGVDDLVGGVPLSAGHRLTLDPWDSLVLADTTPPTDPVRQSATQGK